MGQGGIARRVWVTALTAARGSLPITAIIPELFGAMSHTSVRTSRRRAAGLSALRNGSCGPLHRQPDRLLRARSRWSSASIAMILYNISAQHRPSRCSPPASFEPLIGLVDTIYVVSTRAAATAVGAKRRGPRSGRHQGRELGARHTVVIFGGIYGSIFRRPGRGRRRDLLDHRDHVHLPRHRLVRALAHHCRQSF
jgi:hypothetical protein